MQEKQNTKEYGTLLTGKTSSEWHKKL